MNCSTCRFARMFGTERMCVRFPRTVVRDEGNNVSMLPRVLDDDGCGEHRPARPWWRFW